MAFRTITKLAMLLVLVSSAACGTVEDVLPDGAPPSDSADDATATGVTLTITRSGGSTGTVTSSPAGIDCGAECTLTVPSGTVVTLTATPGTDAELAGWSGGGCSGTGSCELTLDADVTVDAKFELARFAVTVSPIGSGTITSAPAGIDCGGDCSESYPVGTSVTLTATPAAGSTFVGWAGDGCSGTGACTLVVSGAVNVQAAFAMNNALIVAKVGNGLGTVTSPSGIDCGNDCMESYAPGTTVVLTATPDDSSVFAGWSGACSGTGTCTVTVTAAAMVTATFTLKQFQLDVTRLGTGTGTVKSMPAGIDCGTDCSHLYDYPTVVTLTATASPGSVFTGWGGLCSGTAPCMIAMTATSSVTATFALDTHVLTAARSGNGAGVIASSPSGISCGSDCTQAYAHGTPVTLTATPNVGSVFTGWSGGGCSGTGACMVTMTDATTVTATFTLTQHMLTVTSTLGFLGTVTSSPVGINCGSDCTQLYNWNTDVTLTATTASGGVFVGWSGACSGTSLTCNVDMTTARSVTATFKARGVLYTIRQTDDVLRRLDPVTLQYTNLGALGVDYSFGDCAYSSTNNLVYMVPYTAQILYGVNTGTGAATQVGVHGIAQLKALAHHPPSGQLYAIGTGEHLYRLNPNTGAATFVGTTGIALDGLAWDSTRNRMVGLEVSLNGGTFYTINLTTGAATTLAPAGSINNAGLTYDPVIDRFWAVDSSGNLFEYNPNANMARTTRGTGQGNQTCITYR